MININSNGLKRGKRNYLTSSSGFGLIKENKIEPPIEHMIKLNETYTGISIFTISNSIFKPMKIKMKERPF